jgi:hypothetical protein
MLTAKGLLCILKQVNSFLNQNTKSLLYIFQIESVPYMGITLLPPAGKEGKGGRTADGNHVACGCYANLVIS